MIAAAPAETRAPVVERAVVTEFVAAQREWEHQQSRVLWSCNPVITERDGRWPAYVAARERFFKAKAAMEAEA